jgi:hypothetical protein
MLAANPIDAPREQWAGGEGPRGRRTMLPRMRVTVIDRLFIVVYGREDPTDEESAEEARW